MASGCSVSKTMIQLLYARKKLSLLPSSTADLLHLLQQLEEILSKVQQSPSESVNDALNPIRKLIFAKELVAHSDMNVNVSVACCISEIMRIMAPKNPSNENEQMKDLFEMVVTTFEKLSSSNGGCYDKMTKVFDIFSSIRLWVVMLDLERDGYGLIVRLFKQFLIAADSNSSVLVFEMEKIMTTIIDESKELALQFRSLIVTMVKSDTRIASPVGCQLGEKVLVNFAARLKPNLSDMGQDMSIALYDYSKMVASICGNALENEVIEAKETIQYTTHKIKLECPEMLNSGEDAIRHTVSLLGIHSKDNEKHEKKSHTFLDDSLKFLTEWKGKRKRNNGAWRKQDVEHGENLVGCRIKVWWPADKMYYPGVVEFFDFRKKMHKVLYDDGDAEILNLKRQRWKMVKRVSVKPGSSARVLPDTICVHGYNVKPSAAPVLEAIFNKYGDIAAKCVFKADPVRASLLELVCDIINQTETKTETMTDKLEEIKRQVSSVEAVNINVSWLRAHLEAINRTNDSTGGLGLLTSRT